MVDYPNTSCSIRAIDAKEHASSSILGKIKSIFLGLIKWWSVPTLFINMAVSIALCHLVESRATYQMLLLLPWVFDALVTLKFWDVMHPKAEKNIFCAIIMIGSLLVILFFPAIPLMAACKCFK